ncbi:related to Probable transcriptional regulatory protein HAH1 [Saccharomycodes ludwigii]|uniref:Related to Probable transcriptional regulatory protein HAH1 n=1 Tax=Saccharomycodes ludwigii TaxID=36035 RepID=A0A376B1J9_9ASCO|nr:hypothetical protein SCDLUD_001437 [Saccharomycodes ludwigii]KAH3901667.1 hypothetical protein SCDLUD_001437 [Saccharomycodes ludwigii]SSD58558.1 related to Probable transcriptional regulatory protein HAH1 [Saccharomycodes ludwigii]
MLLRSTATTTRRITSNVFKSTLLNTECITSSNTNTTTPFIKSFTVLTNPTLSGHNKWSSIKHDKAKNDAERNKLFSKFANKIALAVKLGGGNADPKLNVRLASAIEQACKANVTKRVIDNAIKKGSGANGGNNGELCIYEGIGPSGIAFVIECLTDNKNRTVGLVRAAFNKIGGSMTPTLYFFDRMGYISISPLKDNDNYDVVFDDLLTNIEGVEDLQEIEPDEQEQSESLQNDEEAEYSDKIFEISCDPSITNTLAQEIKEKLKYKIKDISIGFQPKSDMLVEIGEKDEARIKLEKFYSTLDEIDDVTEIYTNVKED